MSRRIAPLLAIANIAFAVPALAQSTYVVQQGPTYAPSQTQSVAIIAPTIYGDDTILPAYVTAYPDPAWKLCQIDEPHHVRRYYYCGPYSYHPYGVNGYRPFGTYGTYRAVPVRVQLPAAKIIAIPAN